MNRVLATLLLVVILGCRSSSPRSEFFTDPACPIVFSYPPGWRAQVAGGTDDATYKVLLFASSAEADNYRNGSEKMQIELYNEPIQEGIYRAGFDRDDNGEWVQLSGVSTPKGSEIKTGHAAGVEGLVITRDGGEYPIVALGNSQSSVVISGEGLRDAPAGAFELVVSTMEFR